MTGKTDRIERARMEADQARQRLTSTMGALQHRLRPATLMSNAWGGVKEKSGAVADGALEAVKARPVTVSGIVAAVALFLAREPIRELISDLCARKNEGESSENAAEPVAAISPEPHKKHVIAAPAAVARRATGRTKTQGASA